MGHVASAHGGDETNVRLGWDAASLVVVAATDATAGRGG